nr:MAG TPA: hypothetical protein [Caudoviricetes sp.]
MTGCSKIPKKYRNLGFLSTRLASRAQPTAHRAVDFFLKFRSLTFFHSVFFSYLCSGLKLGCDSLCRFSLLPPWCQCQQWWTMWSFDAQREQCCLSVQCELRCCPQLIEFHSF